MTIQGKSHDTEKSFLNDAVEGDWYFDDTVAPEHLYIETPGGTTILPIGAKCREEWGHPCWTWDGSFNAPTITPSIRIRSTSKGEWHGWMREGKLVSA